MMFSLIIRGRRSLRANYRSCKQKTQDKQILSKNKILNSTKLVFQCNFVNLIISKTSKGSKMKRSSSEDLSRTNSPQLRDFRTTLKIDFQKPPISRREWRRFETVMRKIWRRRPMRKNDFYIFVNFEIVG